MFIFPDEFASWHIATFQQIYLNVSMIDWAVKDIEFLIHIHHIYSLFIIHVQSEDEI